MQETIQLIGAVFDEITPPPKPILDSHICLHELDSSIAFNSVFQMIVIRFSQYWS